MLEKVGVGKVRLFTVKLDKVSQAKDCGGGAEERAIA